MEGMEIVGENEVLKVVQARGPMIPLEIRRVLGRGDSITIGAVLSTLTEKGKIMVTHLKQGGSPFYFVPGQEENFESLSKFLNEKDQRTVSILKQKKIIKDRGEEPLIRVSLRNIPDFAKRFDLEIGGQQEIFWYWYMLPEEEAFDIIRKMQRDASKESKDSGKEVAKETLKDAAKNAVKEAKAVKDQETSKSAGADQTSVSGINEKGVASANSSLRKSAAKQDLNHDIKSGIKSELQAVAQPGLNNTSSASTLSKDKSATIANQGQNETQVLQSFNSAVGDFFSSEDGFLITLKKFFDDSKITVSDPRLLKKGSEYEFIIFIPTPVGTVEYFCKAKSKKKCNEGDLSSAYVQGQSKRLPTLFLTTGEVVKKAREKLKTDFKGMIVKEIKN